MSNTYYLAYGSNLNKGQMQYRCPKAQEVGKLLLPDYRLVFKGVADIIEAKGYSVPVGLWLITPDCEKALDRYEGFPTLYRKQWWKWTPEEGQEPSTLMAYVMNRTDICPPSEGYYQSIAEGYKDFGIPDHYLVEALRHSHDNKSGVGHHPKRFKLVK